MYNPFFRFVGGFGGRGPRGLDGYEGGFGVFGGCTSVFIFWFGGRGPRGRAPGRGGVVDDEGVAWDFFGIWEFNLMLAAGLGFVLRLYSWTITQQCSSTVV